MLPKNKKKLLNEYLEKAILPMYDEADYGHDATHIKNVYKIAKKIAKKYNNDIDYNILKTACYMHDLYNMEDRENHHILASEHVMHDYVLKNVFNKEELLIISNACLEHRSKASPKFSLYSFILNDADKLDGIEINRMILRSYYYNIQRNVTNKDIKVIYNDVYNHLKGKYLNNPTILKLRLSYDIYGKEYTKTKKYLSNKNLFLLKMNNLVNSNKSKIKSI